MARSRRSTVVAALAGTPLAVAVLVGACSAGGGAGWTSGPTGGDGHPGPAQRMPVTRLTPLTEEDGYVPEGEGLELSAEVPALERLDPRLWAAVREAAAAAEAEGVDVVVTSGWRSERYQRFLLEAAVTTYGSEEEAARWVATAEESSHVTGDAVDVGYTDAADWFSRFGAEFGLCQTYANELWHYELAVEPGGECPPPAADAAGGA
ncbi:M15 family metallopeptidase [Nocardiopsis sp. NRRL B-16309]|uniref:M15 family metallopeptidase n=1 Tax=Nocardiopsis sp. NRRL B-16309 TaxID=1519494 RepID=UPI0006AEEA97|nr:M15 family metallopeptidase [Nocardiopsis sp. NRRL B-16309]KOX22053.1 D-alanyl-D-alanine carboxypeptidase [Nocardiopsis sp. NRRL B-16309]